MLPRAERQLRRLVADLAGATPDDIQAVLSGLEESQRETVEAMLADYAGSRPAVAVSEADPAPTLLDGVSPWLLARLARGSNEAASDALWRSHDLSFSMTPHAVEVLREEARELRTAPGLALAPAPRAEGWLARLLGGRRRETAT